jgi:ABC-type uncharacterized transport system ATPase subunit
MPKVLELSGITKRFPGVLANDHIDITLNKGEILALLGENGAGKTTLMNILYGLYKPDEGTIRINGKEVAIKGPTDAIAQGIGMVHQHFMLIPVMTVTENVMLGVEQTRAGMVLDKKSVEKRILEISDQYGLEVDPTAYIKDIPVGTQQRVEIIKVLFRHAEILILDEPTAVLTPQEVEGLFQVIHSLIDKGISVIFITHKLKEVMEIADRITVLRQGRSVGTVSPKETNPEKLAAMMVGRDVNLTVEKTEAKPGDVALEVNDLYVRDERENLTVNGLSLDVHLGEILGIAGVQGNGQTELVYALTGLSKPEAGEIKILGETLKKPTPRKILEKGVAHVPEDRQKHGLILTFPVYDNLVLCTYYLPPFSARGVLQEKTIISTAEELVDQYSVRTPNVYVNASTLSGGNQQKVIIARELSRPTKLVIASQPTRGLDVGSIEYIHKQIVKKRDEGTAVLLVSPELDEIIALSDRIAVMYKGHIVDVVPGKGVNRQYLGLLMAGVSVEEALATTPRMAAKVEVERVF